LTSLDLDPLERNENFVQDFSYSDLQPPKAIDCQIAADLMIQGDSVPFCFESFQFLKGRLHSTSSNEKPITNQQSLSFNVEDESQIIDEVVEDEIHDVMMQEDSIPFCFEAFQFIRQNFHIVPKE